jgi:nucleotide-binding universal stress UspA family protein
MISRILVGFDGSECAQKALTVALDMANKYDAKIAVINVMQLPVINNPDDPLSLTLAASAYIKELREIIHQGILQKAIDTAQPNHSDLQIEAIFREGDPATQIASVAEEGRFDMIVLGHGGQSKVKEFFMGGTSERVAHFSRCPVLIVK